LNEEVVVADSASRSFGTGDERVQAVHNVSLTVVRGEFVSIVGPSGSGKSSLLHLLAGLTLSDTGRVAFCGTDFASLSDEARSQLRLTHIGLVLPMVSLIPTLSAWENVTLPLLLAGKQSQPGKARAEELLNGLGMGHRCGVAANRLSNGEAQRVAMARALLHEPCFVVADEPTSFLDSVRSDELAALLRRCADENGCAVVMATHDVRAAAFADRTLSLTDGELQSA
jgi:putative ABC transport system ATP-binding protein